jgi:hypothetical protein
MTREQYLESLLEMYLQLAKCFTVAGFGHAVARTREALSDKTVVRNDAGSPTPAQILRWMCERGTEHELVDRSELVARCLDGLTPEQAGVVYKRAESFLSPALRDIALALAFAVEWRRVPEEFRTDEEANALNALWHAMGNYGHALSKSFRIQFTMIDGHLRRRHQRIRYARRRRSRPGLIPDATAPS